MAFDWKAARAPGSTLVEVDGIPVVLAPDGKTAFSAVNGAPAVVGRVMSDGVVVSEDEFEALVAAPKPPDATS